MKEEKYVREEDHVDVVKEEPDQNRAAREEGRGRDHLQGPVAETEAE